MNTLGEKLPLVIYDGECTICRDLIRRLRRWTGDRVQYTAYQDAGGKLTGIGTEVLATAVHLIEPDGRIYMGAHAVFRLLARHRGWGWVLWLYRHMPGFAPVSEWIYRWVARHRSCRAGR